MKKIILTSFLTFALTACEPDASKTFEQVSELGLSWGTTGKFDQELKIPVVLDPGHSRTVYIQNGESHLKRSELDLHSPYCSLLLTQNRTRKNQHPEMKVTSPTLMNTTDATDPAIVLMSKGSDYYYLNMGYVAYFTSSYDSSYVDIHAFVSCTRGMVPASFEETSKMTLGDVEAIFGFHWVPNHMSL